MYQVGLIWAICFYAQWKWFSESIEKEQWNIMEYLKVFFDMHQFIFKYILFYLKWHFKKKKSEQQFQALKLQIFQKVKARDRQYQMKVCLLLWIISWFAWIPLVIMIWFLVWKSQEAVTFKLFNHAPYSWDSFTKNVPNFAFILRRKVGFLICTKKIGPLAQTKFNSHMTN